MPYQTLRQSTNFVDSIAIAPRTTKSVRRRELLAGVPSNPAQLQDTTAQAVVAGAGLVLAEEGVTKQVKDDLLRGMCSAL